MGFTFKGPLLLAVFVASAWGYRTSDGVAYIHPQIHNPARDAFPVAPNNTGAVPTYEWISVEGAQCMEKGSQTGFWLREGNPDKLVVFLMGGGACFNSLCSQLAASKPKGYDEGQTPPNTGVFRPNDGNPDKVNPLGDHTVVFIPYCTGDVFMGNQQEETAFSGILGGSTKRTFRGRNHLEKVMESLPGSPNINAKLSSFVLTGESAGGFGTLASWDFIRGTHFGNKGQGTPFTVNDGKALLIDDSGIAMGSKYLTPCLTKYWSRLFRFDTTLPAGCPECQKSLYAIYPFLQKKYPKDTFAFISTDSDEIIHQFYGFGHYEPHDNGECGDGKNALIPLPNTTGWFFRDGVKEFFLDYVIGDGIDSNRFASYFFPGTDHTHSSEDSFFFTTAIFNDLDGKTVSLVEWYQNILDGNAMDVETNLFNLNQLAAIRKMKRA